MTDVQTEILSNNFEKKVSFAENDCTLKNGILSDVAETVEDPFCDEKNPRVITFQDVCQAAFMIRGLFSLVYFYVLYVTSHQVNLIILCFRWC